MMLVLASIAGVPGGGALAGMPAAMAQEDGFCSKTADKLLGACKAGVEEERQVGAGDCVNIFDETRRNRCFRNNAADVDDGLDECGTQHDARLALCGAVGEARYAPRLDDDRFVDPMAIGGSVEPNPYLILTPGYTRIYHSPEGAVITVEVTHRTRVLAGIPCIIVHDFEKEDGKLVEDTEDYMAQDVDGNVWYFGEFSKSFDDNGRLRGLGGSFLAGVDGGKPGIVMQAAPQVGQTYREEWSLANAEDFAKVLSITASQTVPAATCTDTCLLTENSSPIDPDDVEHKFYAPGIGELVAFPVDDPTDREALFEYHY